MKKEVYYSWYWGIGLGFFQEGNKTIVILPFVMLLIEEIYE